MKGKFKLSSLLVFGCMLMLPFVVNASSTPVYDEDTNTFYANGTPIVIAEVDGNTEISWNDGANSEVVNATTTVYGGGVAGTSFESSSIIMNSGTVANIFGGGEGTATESADVKSVTIVVNGGTVVSYLSGSKYVGGNVAGGGTLASKVDTAKIEVKGGNVGAVMGGGKSSHAGKEVGTISEPEKSLNSTGTVELSISAGTINDANYGYGLVYGGGQGYSYVKETTVNISGTADLSKAWLTGGGANGRTDTATVNISGGTINIAQSINRGSMIDANVNVTGGTISKLYVGGEDPESYDDDIVNGGFLGNVVVDITGGEVTELLPGSNYDESIEANADYVMVFANPESIANTDTVDAAFGTSIKPYVTDGETTYVIDVTEEDVVLDGNLFGALAATGNIYTIGVSKEDGTLYAWAFNGGSITDSTITVNTEVTFTEAAPDRVKSDIEGKVTDLENIMYLNFTHHGALPGDAAISYDVSETYESGTTLYVRHFNETTKTLEDPIEVVVDEDGVMTFELSSCSTFVISTTANQTADTIPNPPTGDNILSIVAFLVIGVIGVSLATKKLAKN